MDPNEVKNKEVVVTTQITPVVDEKLKEKLQGQAGVLLSLIEGYVNWTSNKQDSYGKPFVSFSMKYESPIAGMTVQQIADQTIEAHKTGGFHMFVTCPDLQGRMRKVRIIAYNPEKNMLVASDDAMQEFTVRKFESHYSGVPKPEIAQATAPAVDQGKYFNP